MSIKFQVTESRDRSTSPLPNIQRALFKSDAKKATTSRKRSSRPSLEDDLRKASSSPLLGPENDKENELVPSRLSSKVSKSSISSPSMVEANRRSSRPSL